MDEHLRNCYILAFVDVSLNNLTTICFSPLFVATTSHRLLLPSTVLLLHRVISLPLRNSFLSHILAYRHFIYTHTQVQSHIMQECAEFLWVLCECGS